MHETEQLARLALAAARREAKPIEPDRWDRDGEDRGRVSFARFEEAAQELLDRHEIDVEQCGGVIAGNVYRTIWSWSWGEYTSRPRRIDIPLEVERGKALAAASAAVSTGWRIYVRWLLRLRTAEDLETGLSKAMDSARTAAYEAVREALDAYCKRNKCSMDRAIRAFTGIDPGSGVEATVAMLNSQAIAMVWWKLECNLPHESVGFDPGASPRLDDDLPPAMGGQEVVNG